MNTGNPTTPPHVNPAAHSSTDPATQVLPVIPVATKKSRGFNIPAPIAILLVLLLAAGAGWYVYMEVFPPKVDLSLYDIPTNGGGGAGRQMRFGNPMPNPALQNNPANAAENMKARLLATGGANTAGMGVINRADGYDVRIPGARARLSRSGNTWKTELAYTDVNYLPLADRWAQLARWNAIDATRAAGAKLTPDQVEKLKAINFPREMEISDADRAKLIALVPAYKDAATADKPAAEKALVDAFRDIAVASIVPSQAAFTQAAEQVRAVLSREQITVLRGRQN